MDQTDPQIFGQNLRAIGYQWLLEKLQRAAAAQLITPQKVLPQNFKKDGSSSFCFLWNIMTSRKGPKAAAKVRSSLGRGATNINFLLCNFMPSKKAARQQRIFNYDISQIAGSAVLSCTSSSCRFGSWCQAHQSSRRGISWSCFQPQILFPGIQGLAPGTLAVNRGSVWWDLGGTHLR